METCVISEQFGWTVFICLCVFNLEVLSYHDKDSKHDNLNEHLHQK